MKKLCTALILCLVSIMAQGQQLADFINVGYNQSCGRQYPISVTEPKDGKYDMLIVCQGLSDNYIHLVIRNNEREQFRESLMFTRDKFINFQKASEEKNVSEFGVPFLYDFPKVTIGWLGDSWEISKNNELVIEFHVHEGRFYVIAYKKSVISSNNVETMFRWFLCSEDDFNNLLFYLDVENIKKLFQARELLLEEKGS